MSAPRKILVVRFSSIGDIVLTTPVVRCLKNQLDGAEIHYLTKTGFADLLTPNPHIHKVWTINSSVAEVLEQLKQENFDQVIDLHNNIRTKRLKSGLGVPAATLNKLNAKKWLLVNMKVDRLPDVHVVDRYMDTMQELGVENDNQGLDFFFPDNVDDLPMMPQPYIAVVIGGAHDGKRLPVSKWQEVFTELQLPIILLGGSDDVAMGEQLDQTFDHVNNKAGQTSLFESAQLVKHARVVITNDTGLMHVASAFKKNIISLWGQTTPRFGMYPYMAGPDSMIIEPNPKQRTLSKLGNKKTNPHVMERIPASEVVQAALRLYEAASSADVR